MTRILSKGLLSLLFFGGILNAQVSTWGVEFHFVEFQDKDGQGNQIITAPLVLRFRIDGDGKSTELTEVGSTGGLKGEHTVVFRSATVRGSSVRASLELGYSERRSSTHSTSTVDVTASEVHTLLSPTWGGHSRRRAIFVLRIPIEQPPEDHTPKPWPVDSYARYVLDSVRRQDGGSVQERAEFLRMFPLREVFAEPEVLELRRDIKNAALRHPGGQDHLYAGTVSSLVTLLAATGDMDALKHIVSEMDFRPDLVPFVQGCLKNVSDPHAYGQIAMSLMQSSSFRRREAFTEMLDPLIARVEDGTAILPGGPEEQNRALASLKAMRTEKQFVAPLLMLLFGGAAIVLVAFLLHRLSIRLTA